MVKIHRKLTGEELHIIRMKYNINPNIITKLSGMTPVELLKYEYEDNLIPDDVYDKWLEVIKPYIK